MGQNTLIRTAIVGALCALSSLAWARTVEDCQLAWGQAARSYGAAKGGVPEDGAFKAACELEAKGDKDAARVEAVTVATMALSKQSAEACERFLKNYIGAKDPGTLCATASGEDQEAIRKAVAAGLPEKKSKKK